MVLLLKHWKLISIALLAAGAVAYVAYLREAAADARVERNKAQEDSKAARMSLSVANSRYAALEKGGQAVAAIDRDLLKENDDAQAATDRTIADLRSGNLRLRKQLAARTCRTGEASAAAGGRDEVETTGLSNADGEFLIRLADEADDAVRQLSACQIVVEAYRKQVADAERPE